jgi:hypothetical protein
MLPIRPELHTQRFMTGMPEGRVQVFGRITGDPGAALIRARGMRKQAGTIPLTPKPRNTQTPETRNKSRALAREPGHTGHPRPQLPGTTAQSMRARHPGGPWLPVYLIADGGR